MSTYALLMAKAKRKYFRENFNGTESEYLAQQIFPHLRGISDQPTNCSMYHPNTYRYI